MATDWEIHNPPKGGPYKRNQLHFVNVLIKKILPMVVITVDAKNTDSIKCHWK